MKYLVASILSVLMVLTPASTHEHHTPVERVRPPSNAGTFYVADARRLGAEVDSLLAAQDSRFKGEPMALIVPHAGYHFSGNVAATAYATLNPARSFRRVFILGPSHYEWLDGASVDINCAWYQTPLGKLPVDVGVGKSLIEADEVFTCREEAHDREHCIEVQLPFLQRRLKHTPAIVPIIISTNKYDHLERIASALKPYLTPDNLFVISSDFSHYPAYHDACEVDRLTRDALMTGDVEQFIAVLNSNAKSGRRQLETSACGEYPLITLLMLLEGRHPIHHLRYQNSGDVEGGNPKRVVGYHAFAVTGNSTEAFTLTKADKRYLKGLARQAIATALEGKDQDMKATDETTLSNAVRTSCGVFVTLRTPDGNLRGCIGHIGYDTPLYRLVPEMARAAAFEDRRFSPLTAKELKGLTIEISVLTPMQRIHGIDEFQLHHHGLLIRKDGHSGTFLPQVADEVNWTKEEFFGHCSQDKAGLGWDGWRDAELYVYEAIVF